jgi:hypothetical protein
MCDSTEPAALRLPRSLVRLALAAPRLQPERRRRTIATALARHVHFNLGDGTSFGEFTLWLPEGNVSLVAQAEGYAPGAKDGTARTVFSHSRDGS